MSQGFKLRFDEMKESNPAQSASKQQDNNSAFFPSEGGMRILCLVFKNGNMRGYPYAYIVDYACELDLERNKIILELSSKIITLSGFGLSALYLAILKQLPEFIYETEERYANQQDWAVLNIQIEGKSEG